MNKNFTLSFLFIFTFFMVGSVYSQCPTWDTPTHHLSSQAEVDAFGVNYPNCTTVPAGVELSIDGDDITNLNGLLGLEVINGQLEIQNCPNLTSLAGLANLTTVNPTGELEIENCDALTNLDGLEGLTSCYDLEIKSCANLENIDALNGLTVTGEFVVKNNPSLTDCDGLCNAILNGIDPNDVEVFNNGGSPCDDFNDWEAQCLAALPVDLTSFKGYVMDRSNMLKWQTASEENTMVFLIERSLDGRRNFTEIGHIDAIGNSTSLRNYEMEDGNPVSLAYYRLRIVDFDGTYEFSDVIAVERSKTEIDLVEVYPVPAEEEITVLVHAKAAGKAIMTLSDFMGRKIKEEKIVLKTGINRYNFNWEERETNFYYLTIYNGSERIAKKILRASTD